MKECQYCGDCCSLSEVIASEKEVKAIAEAKQLEISDFSWENHPVKGEYRIKWKEKSVDCFFLKRDGDRVFCDIYIYIKVFINKQCFFILNNFFDFIIQVNFFK